MGIGERANEIGVFYLILLKETPLGPLIKCGFTAHLKRRLSSHRATVPDLHLYTTWQCPRRWEAPLLRSIGELALKNYARETMWVRKIEPAFRRIDKAWEELHQSDPIRVLSGTKSQEAGNNAN